MSSHRKKLKRSLSIIIGILTLFIVQGALTVFAGDLPTQGLGILLQPFSLVASPGQTATFNVIVSRTNNESPIFLEVSGAPEKTLISFSANPVAMTDQESLASLKIPSDASFGSYSIAVKANDESMSVENEIILFVEELK